MVLIERAKTSDAEAIMGVKMAAQIDAYPNADAGVTVEDVRLRWTDEVIAQGIKNWQTGIKQEDGETKMTFVARLNYKVVGVIGPRVTDAETYICNMYVLPNFQNRGIGHGLMNRALEWIGDKNDIYLNVVAYNHNAIKFYESFGFVKTDTALPLEAELPGTKPLPEIEMVLKANNSLS
jgi:ribosomal protein S18 acetylase RimI-like enzyme